MSPAGTSQGGSGSSVECIPKRKCAQVGDQARDRLKAAIRRYGKPLADLVARDANEGDTRLLVTEFLKRVAT
jgi:hypothetical protein